jgi:uncharacterized protein YbjT (DUF2867 family)
LKDYGFPVDRLKPRIQPIETRSRKGNTMNTTSTPTSTATPILVAGASGNIGQALVRELRARGAAFQTLSSKAGAGDRVASFADVPALTQAFQGVETLFVVLPLTPEKLQFARNVAAAAKAAGVKHIVRASGAGADPKAGFSLPRLQGEIDAALAESGIATTFLRNAGFMQNYATFMAPMVKSGMVYAATADAKQSLIDVRDIAAVAAVVVTNPSAHAGKAYTLTGGESLTDSERSAILSQATGKTIGYTAIPVEAASKTMANEWHMPAPLVDWMDSLNTLIGLGYAGAISPDVETLLGRKPISFAQFARDHAKVWA